MSFEARHATIKKLLTCGICQKLCRDFTTIDECCHSFCRECITRKITEENLRNCPECNVDLGAAPLHRLKHDYRWQSVKNKYVGIKKLYAEKRSMKSRVKDIVCREAEDHAADPPVDQVASEPPVLDRKGKGKVDQPPNEAVDTESEPVAEPLPSRRKEKSISSLVGQRAASNPAAPLARQRRKYTRRKHAPPQTASLSSMDGGQSQISSKPSPAAAIESPEQQLEHNNQEHGGEPPEDMNDPLRCQDGSAEVVTKSRRRRSAAKIAVASELKTGEPKGVGSASVATGPKQSRKGRPRKEDKSGIAEDLNIPTQVVVDPSSVCGRKRQVWFQLVGCKKQESSGLLPPMPPRYLRVQDANMPARFIKKYVVVKLGLQSEDENKVEIRMRDQPIHPDLQLHQLMELWIKTLKRSERKKTVAVGSSGEDFVMIVTYSLQLQSEAC